MNDPDPYGPTGDWREEPETRAAGSATPQLPDLIGRYRIEKLLGRGGFGVVFLAYDDQLQRNVAIKVPHAELVRSPEDAEAYLAEARIVANLDHANIVPVHDVGSTAEFPCYIVCKYIEGGNLAERLDNSRLNYVEASELAATVAEALHYAHIKGVVHRDVKPGNILIDVRGKPYVADFGLALKEVDFGKGHGFAGTLVYMSPEQARGEGHRVDGRSDIFSLGVVFYELLTGRRPFRGDSRVELLGQITKVEPRPPRQVDDSIPKELERICLKALSKRASERYTTALDMAEDLRHFLAGHLVIEGMGTPQAGKEPADGPTVAQGDSSTVDSDRQPLRIVPKGLRSFDEHDADFFLGLLPGARDRDGLPESIRFWKTRIEETDADKTFSIGLIYGPSGCGKSSLVKAGLLPRLGEEVIAIYVEATANETETRLLKGLHKRCDGLPDGLGLNETLSALRRGQGVPADGKVLIVLDQFEQWLHAKREDEETELVQALRHCDGGNVQCIVLVRDDFWMAATNFMQELEIPLLEGQNSAAVNLFPIRHAEKVLTAFGRAFGALPDHPSDPTPEQHDFITHAVEGLADDGKVICVRLALFAEMMKGKPWTPASLKAVGGTEGIGVTFLEETFSASTAPPQHRLHQKASRAVLKALLPESGANIKGHMRSHDELLAASGYANRRRDFDDLIHILDSEIRLITPTDPEGVSADEDDDSTTQIESGQKYYQLTHDYLVPSLREWLTRKQRETRRGRAELRLAERTGQWRATRERRHLPSLVEYLTISLGVPRKKRTSLQRELMRAAARHHGLRWGSLSALVLATVLTVQYLITASRVENDRQRAETLVKAVLTARPDGVPYTIDNLKPLRDLAIPSLQARFADDTIESNQRLHAAFALFAFGQSNEDLLDFVVGQVASASSAEFRNFESALGHLGNEATKRLAKLAASEAAATNNAAKQYAETKDDAVKSKHANARDRHAKAQCRLAILLLHLGKEGAAVACVNPSPDSKDHMLDPITRTTFIHEFWWHGDIERLGKFLRTEDSAFRAAMCLALGLAPDDRLPAGSRETLQDPLLDLYRTAADGSTHSAAGRTLRKWGILLPPLEAVDPDDARDWFVNEQGITLLKIRAGKFTMGSETGFAGEKPVHVVTLTKPFWLGDREVTVGQFRQFVQDEEYFKQFPDERPVDWEKGFKRLEHVSPTDNSPAHSVSWLDSIYFCNWLTRRATRDLRPCYEKTGGNWGLDPSGTGYRLPSEAEWEYACRSGSGSAYCFGDDKSMLESYAVYGYVGTQPAGSKLPSSWGLFDMHGNLYEWCNDWYVGYPSGSVTDPTGEAMAAGRISRGGSWFDAARFCRSARRDGYEPGRRYLFLGFRVAAVQSSSK